MVTLLNSSFPFIHKLTFYLAHIPSLPLPTFHTCFPLSKTYPCSLLWFISVNSISKLGKLVWDCFMSCNASWSRGVGGHSANWQQVRSDPWFHVTYQPVLASCQSWRFRIYSYQPVPQLGNNIDFTISSCRMSLYPTPCLPLHRPTHIVISVYTHTCP